MGTAAAIVGSAIIGGASSRSASKRAEAGQKRAQQSIQQGQLTARQDVLNLFPTAQRSLLGGGQQALEVFQRTAPLQQQQLLGGNLAAQQSVRQGFDQARNALLGIPTSNFAVSAPQVSDQPLFGDVRIFDTAAFDEAEKDRLNRQNQLLFESMFPDLTGLR